MTTTDWFYVLIAAYLIIMGLLGINLRIIWITITFKIKVYDFEDLYGRTAGRILFIILGVFILIFNFVIMKSLFGGIL